MRQASGGLPERRVQEPCQEIRCSGPRLYGRREDWAQEEVPASGHDLVHLRIYQQIIATDPVCWWCYISSASWCPSGSCLADVRCSLHTVWSLGNGNLDNQRVLPMWAHVLVQKEHNMELMMVDRACRVVAASQSHEPARRRARHPDRRVSGCRWHRRQRRCWWAQPGRSIVGRGRSWARRSWSWDTEISSNPSPRRSWTRSSRASLRVFFPIATGGRPVQEWDRRFLFQSLRGEIKDATYDVPVRLQFNSKDTSW